MLMFVYIILMIFIFGGILKFAIKAAWGISKIVCSIVLLPLFLIWLVVKGFIVIAIPILIVIGIISVLSWHK